MKVPALLVAASLLASLSCFGQSEIKLPCGDMDQKCALEAMMNHVTRRLDTWQAMLRVPIGERIAPATPQLVEYLNLDNIKSGFSTRARTAELDTDLRADVTTAIADLPKTILNLFEQRLIGLYFVENLGSTGYTEYVRDQNGKPAAALIVLDAAVLTQKTANEWATWKENTPFSDGMTYKLDARIEANANDNRKNAIQYILLHELGHVLAIGTNIHPVWDIKPSSIETAAKYPFFNLSWRIDRAAENYTSVSDAEFPQRLRAVYYFGARLSAADILPAYLNLENTNFVSLYAATNPFDDFAESFATYVLVVLMKRPWQIEITRNSKVVHTVKSCWGHQRCAEKQEFLQLLLKDPPWRKEPTRVQP